MNRFIRKYQITRLNTRFVLSAFFSAILVTGCSLFGSSKSPQDSTVMLQISTSTDLNPGPDLQPSPVRLRIFLTEPDNDLISQPFETVFEFKGTALGSKPIATVLVRPEQSLNIELKRSTSQSHLTVAAAFHDIYNSAWIVEKSLPQDNHSISQVYIDSASVEIQ